MRCTARSAPSAPTIDDRDVAAHDDEFAVGVPRHVRLRILTVPSKFDSMKDWSAICAAPPMWKVRIVSCVPGSPIDCAAMTPTASP